MKKSLLALSGLILPLVASAAVSVEWVAPENYRDAYASSSKSDKSRQMALDDFQSFIIAEASPLIKESDNLKISVTQLDMTGEFEPWVQNRENVRMMKSPYFGKITFNYVLTGADGKVIKEGEENLTNQMLTPIDIRDKDEMDPYLRDSLRSWMRSTLKNAKSCDNSSDKSCGAKK
jgi:hypothetical protein